VWFEIFCPINCDRKKPLTPCAKTGESSTRLPYGLAQRKKLIPTRHTGDFLETIARVGESTPRKKLAWMQFFSNMELFHDDFFFVWLKPGKKHHDMRMEKRTI